MTHIDPNQHTHSLPVLLDNGGHVRGQRIAVMQLLEDRKPF